MVRGGLLYINARFRPRWLRENWKFEGAIDAMCVSESLTNYGDVSPEDRQPPIFSTEIRLLFGPDYVD
jgi:hypothetical protein